MGKIKGMLEESMMRNPELYNGHADEEFWTESRKRKVKKKRRVKNEEISTW